MFKQENVILPCSLCQVKYNVTNLRAGTKFKCNKCGTVNMVPVREDTPTEFIPRAEVSNLPIRQSPTAPAVSVKKSTVRLSVPSSPAVSALKPTVRTPQPQIRPSTGIRQSPVTRPSAVKKGVTGGKAIRRQETEGPEGIEPKKKSKTLLIIGIIGGVALLVIFIWAMSCDDKSKEKEKKMIADAEKAAAEKEKEKTSQPEKETPKETKEPEKTPEPEPKKVEEPKPPKETKPPKGKLEIDEAVQTEVLPLVKDMRNQKDDEQKVTIEKIIAKGKKAIPVLIGLIGGDDDRAAMYAYEILIKITKRNRDDTIKVTPMLNREMRKDCQKEWEEWWLKSKDTIPD